MILWLTGNTGAGKTSLARHLTGHQRNTAVLDGDAMREAVSRDLGLTLADRLEHNERVARLATTLEGQGLTVVVAVIAPTRVIRDRVRELCGCVFIHVEGGSPDNARTPYERPSDDEIAFRVMA